jgi:hypothetical protein
MDEKKAKLMIKLACLKTCSQNISALPQGNTCTVNIYLIYLVFENACVNVFKYDNLKVDGNEK